MLSNSSEKTRVVQLAEHNIDSSSKLSKNYIQHDDFLVLNLLALKQNAQQMVLAVSQKIFPNLLQLHVSTFSHAAKFNG